MSAITKDYSSNYLASLELFEVFSELEPFENGCPPPVTFDIRTCLLSAATWSIHEKS